MPHDVIYDETVAGLGSLAGRVCAITGSTSGTGYHTAIAANRGGVACILLLNRPSPRAEGAVAPIKAAGAAEVLHVDCDLQSFDSVRAAAAIVAAESAKRGGLDVLACNAGVMAVPDRRTGDGFDVQMHTACAAVGTACPSHNECPTALTPHCSAHCACAEPPLPLPAHQAAAAVARGGRRCPWRSTGRPAFERRTEAQQEAAWLGRSRGQILRDI
eukprot:2290873-Prymnesium_polylepis.1